MNELISQNWFSLHHGKRWFLTLSILLNVGDWPPYAPKSSSKLIDLIQPDKEMFLKGLHAKNKV